MSTFPSVWRVAPAVLALGLLGAACGGDAGGIEASGAWARTSPANAEAGAVYMTLSSDEAVSFVSASVPADVAGTVELHETVPVETDTDESAMDESMDEDSMDEGAMEEDGHSLDEGAVEDMAMTMRALSSIDIPAGGQVALEPGGMHAMLLDLANPLEQGETFELTLTTADGDELSVEVEVRDEAP